MKKLIWTVIVCGHFLASAGAWGYVADGDGNHSDMKSESWCWMGHLNVVTNDGALTREGIGYILYYTRNDQGPLGSMNFRSTSVTPTVDGVGKTYSTHTLYAAEHPEARLKVRRGTLDLTFSTDRVHDHVRAQGMDAADHRRLGSALALFPGLKIAPGFQPRKTVLQVQDEDGGQTRLDLFAIWPQVSPPEGRMPFLGQADTYEFAEPMLVTVGTFRGQNVVGLSFLDRQWAKEYFGQHMVDGLKDSLTYARALNFAHSWSAFHVFDPRTASWAFFHVWHQFQREPGADQLVDYSSLLWMRDGISAGTVAPDAYAWTSSGFVEGGGRSVLMEYGMGRYGVFPSRANFNVPELGLELELRASPANQTLDQPIYFYEGFASGEGTWNGNPVQVYGRLESSRYLFRTQDYREILTTLSRQRDPRWQQPDLQMRLHYALTHPDSEGPGFPWFNNGLARLASLLGDLELKLAIFGSILSHQRSYPDAADPTYMIYR